MSREILGCLANTKQGSPAVYFIRREYCFLSALRQRFRCPFGLWRSRFRIPIASCSPFRQRLFPFGAVSKECGAVVECNHTVKTVACCSDRNDYFASCDISQSKSFFDFHQPLSPLSCLSISSITISYISPSVLQYCKTSHGSLV